MSYKSSNPKSTASIESAIASWTGQDNPISKRQGDINPAPHGFNKASKAVDPQTWGGK